MDNTIKIYLVTGIACAMFIYLLLEKRMKSHLRKIEKEINGVTFFSNMENGKEVLKEIKQIPKEVLEILAENGYKFYLLEDRFTKPLSFKFKGYKFRFKLDSESLKFYEIDPTNKIVVIDKPTHVVTMIKDVYANILLKEEREINGVNVVFDSHYKMLEPVKEALETLPDWVLKEFTKQDFKLYILSDEAYNEHYGKETDSQGYFFNHKKEIVAKECMFTLGEMFIKETLFHEFGHFMDMYCTTSEDGRYASEDNGEFVVMYRYAKTRYKNTIEEYYLSSPKEFFAYLSSIYFSKQKWFDFDYKYLFRRQFKKVID